MEVLVILFGMIFWPTALILWVVFCRLTKRSLRFMVIGCLPLILLPLLCAVSMGKYMFIDEPLYSAVGAGDTKAVERLLALGADPNMSFEGTPAIVQAATHGNVDVVKLLIHRGAHLDVRDDWEHHSPLEAARIRGSQDIVLVLKSAGAKE